MNGINLKTERILTVEIEKLSDETIKKWTSPPKVDELEAKPNVDPEDRSKVDPEVKAKDEMEVGAKDEIKVKAKDEIEVKSEVDVDDPEFKSKTKPKVKAAVMSPRKFNFETEIAQHSALGEDDDVKDDPDFDEKATRNSKRKSSSAGQKKSKKPKIERCPICLTDLNSPNLCFYTGHPDGAAEEPIALTDPSVQIDVCNDEIDLDAESDKPAYRLTNFSIYDRESHLVDFSDGAIENNQEIFFSGYIKAITDDSPALEKGVAVKDGGSLVNWWSAGFQKNDNSLIGISSEIADYYLTKPSQEYEKIFTQIEHKVLLSKAVICYLEEAYDKEEEMTFENLLTEAQLVLPEVYSASDEIIAHSRHILTQVYNYEDAADTDEDRFMMDSPCIKEIMDLSGASQSRLRSNPKIGMTRTKAPPKKKEFTKATTTPLIRYVFESFFKDQLLEEDKVAQPRKKRCGMCDGCMVKDCGKCSACKNMKKFGGTGTSKQACEKRKCTAIIRYDDGSASQSDDEGDEKENSHNKSNMLGRKSGVQSKQGKIKSTTSNIKWKGERLGKKGDDKSFYSSVVIEDKIYKAGDVVYCQNASKEVELRRIEHLFQWEDGEKYAHFQLFVQAKDTVLKEAADIKEVFQALKCQEDLVSIIIGKASIEYWPIPENWATLGGTEDSVADKPPINLADPDSFWYRFWYDENSCRFQGGVQFTSPAETDELEHCSICYSDIKEKNTISDEVKALDIISDDCDSMGNFQFSSLTFLGKTYHLKDAIFYIPFGNQASQSKERDEEKLTKRKESVDENRYPEFYRKTVTVRGSNECTAKPFALGVIMEILSPEKRGRKKITLKVRKLYRPEDTCLSSDEVFNKDLNYVYWSEEIISVEVARLEGKFILRSENSLSEDIGSWTRGGEHRFYYNITYNKKEKRFEELSESGERYKRSKSKGNGKVKGTGTSCPEISFDGAYPEILRPLKCLDVFSGCGGLSLGLHQAGIADSQWAIEVDQAAAKAYKMNNKSCTVFHDDCNDLLRWALEEKPTNSKGQLLPMKGEVELLCGGPPCQGFSGMNRFNSREYSMFKNSLIASYLSYCDFYRPKYFILENVRNFATFKKSAVLRLCLKALTKMGYSCTFGILQAGHYGVSQTRRRAILLAAAPGYVLPLYPEPQTVFSSTSLSAMIGDKIYTSNCQWSSSAPYRTITVKDVMSDLPKIKNGHCDLVMNYSSEPLSHFQRNIRQDSNVLRDHICKNMSPLVEARMSLIPIERGADWRDLPNIAMELRDGTFTEKLEYKYHDYLRGLSSTGALRGVCICASGKTKSCSEKQANTLIPWCLPHTSARHNQWAGLYGRLSYCGYFHTTVTNPEPMGKQGQVLHPEQHRVVSVRECARSQGFPDTYELYGTIIEKHRQVGNAVPPPMGYAIGIEIRKALAESQKKLLKEDF